MITDINIFALPDRVQFLTEGGTLSAAQSGSRFAAEDIALEITDGCLMLTADQTPVKYCKLRWNGSFKKDTRFLGDAFERAYGNLEWRGFVPHRILPWYFLASDEKETVGFGVKTGPNAFVSWNTDRQGVTMWVDVRCGGRGVILSGRQLETATLVSDTSLEGESAFAFAKRFCHAMCEKPVLPDAPVYGSNNWYYAYGNSSQEEILRDTDLLVELTKGLENRPYMVIDDCWQPLSLAHGAAGRPYDCGNIRFPDMPGLAAEMKKRGVRPGIWIRPIESYEMFLPGRLRCERDRRVLDITEPEVLELIAEDVNRVTSWGYELVKFDFATIDALGRFFMEPIDLMHIPDNWAWHDRSKTNAEAILAMYRVIRENANGAVLIGCNVVGHLAAGILHMHRSGDDTSGFDWGRTMVMGVNTLAFRLPQHGAFFAIDADCVGITKSIDWKMNRQFLRLLALSGTPLFCSMKPSDITDEMKQDLREAFAIAAKQETVMETLDWFETSAPCDYLVDGRVEHFDWMEEEGLSGFHK